MLAVTRGVTLDLEVTNPVSRTFRIYKSSLPVGRLYRYYVTYDSAFVVRASQSPDILATAATAELVGSGHRCRQDGED